MPTYEPKKIVTETENNLVEYTFTDGEGNIVTAQVTPEVYEVLLSEHREERRYAREYQRRGSSLSIYDELVVNKFSYEISFEEKLLSDLEVSRIMEFLNKNTTPTQRKRFLLHRLHGLSFEKIAIKEGCRKMRIKKSVDAVDEKIKIFFEK